MCGFPTVSTLWPTPATTAVPPGKKDAVSFVVTKLDEDRSIAVGIITRIIRQNL